MTKDRQIEHRIIDPKTCRFLLYLQLALVGSTMIFLFAIYVLNIAFGTFDLLTISIVSSSMLTVLVFLDFLCLLPPKWLITNALGILFSFIAFAPILLTFFFPTILQNQFAPLTYAYFYLLIYAEWNLTMYREHRERIATEHPQVMILLQERGLFFMAYAYLSVISFVLSQIISAETINMKITLLWVIAGFSVMSWKPLSSFAGFQLFLRKTKDGRKLKARSYRDQWKEELNQKRIMRVFLYLALPVGILSFYFGGVAMYYFGLVKPNFGNLFAGLLAISVGLSVLFYSLTRAGALSKINKINLARSRPKPNMADTKESIKNLQNWFFGLFGAVIGLIGLLQFKGARTLASLMGTEITDMTLAYIDLFWVSIMLILSRALLSSTKGKKADLPKISQQVNYLSVLSWYFLAGLTGSFAYALGVPGIVDAAVVVAFLLITTGYNIYLHYSK